MPFHPRFVAVTCLFLVAGSGLPAQSFPEVLDVGNRLELFVDDHVIAKLAGSAKLKLQKPAPAEVVFTFDRPWEGNTCAYFTVFRDGDLFRMYYRGSHHDGQKATHPEFACYAESKDGINWTRPNLGLVEFKGSKENNIIWTGPEAHNFTPFKDTNPKALPETRYKALARSRGGLVAFKSADAIHWTRMAEKPVITKGAFDSQNLAFWDSVLGKYRDYHRIGTNGFRDIATCTSDDFVNWTEPIALRYPGAPAEHLYTNAIGPYERAPHILLGFPTRFLAPTQQVEPEFMSSRDGFAFKRWTEPVIPMTAPKDRDWNRSNYMAWGLVELPGHANQISIYATEAYYAGPAGRLRRFTYRTDGFVSINASSEGGEVLTRPLRFQGKKLVLNFATAAKGSVRVELIDENTKPISGFALSDCTELRGDALAQSVSWRGNIASLTGRTIQMRFVLKDADLYSMKID